MTAADQLDDDYPHGTVEGYRRGCKGKICPGVATNDQSCAQAYTRYNSDRGYRRQVDAAAKVSEKLTPAKVQAEQDWEFAQREADLRAHEAAMGLLPAADYAVVPPAGIPAAVKPTPGPGKSMVHGTNHGYNKGCRKSDQANCPAKLMGGKSCYEVHAEYMAARRGTMTKTTEEMTVNAAPEHTPELEATLAELKEKHPPLSEAEIREKALKREITPNRARELMGLPTFDEVGPSEARGIDGSLAKVRDSLAKVNEAYEKLAGGTIEPVTALGADDEETTALAAEPPASSWESKANLAVDSYVVPATGVDAPAFDPTKVGPGVIVRSQWTDDPVKGRINVRFKVEWPVDDDRGDWYDLDDLVPCLWLGESTTSPEQERFTAEIRRVREAEIQKAEPRLTDASTLHTVPAAFGRRDEDGDLQDTETPGEAPVLHSVDITNEHGTPSAWWSQCGQAGIRDQTTMQLGLVTCPACIASLHALTEPEELVDETPALAEDPVIASELWANAIADPWTGHPLANATNEEPRRSPNPVTPYDDPHTLFQRLVWPDLRRMWLKGYQAALFAGDEGVKRG